MCDNKDRREGKEPCSSVYPVLPAMIHALSQITAAGPGKRIWMLGIYMFLEMSRGLKKSIPYEINPLSICNSVRLKRASKTR